MSPYPGRVNLLIMPPPLLVMPRVIFPEVISWVVTPGVLGVTTIKGVCADKLFPKNIRNNTLNKK
jgi:hypothetical protein